MTIEEKLDAFAQCGLNLKDPFGVPDLVESWGREALDEPGWNLALVCLGMTEEKAPWTPHCENLWHFDTECIDGDGSYVRIARRMAKTTAATTAIGPFALPTFTRRSVDPASPGIARRSQPFRCKLVWDEYLIRSHGIIGHCIACLAVVKAKTLIAAELSYQRMPVSDRVAGGDAADHLAEETVALVEALGKPTRARTVRWCGLATEAGNSWRRNSGCGILAPSLGRSAKGAN